MSDTPASTKPAARRGSPLQSVRVRLVLWNAATLVLLLVMLGVITHFFVRSYMLATVDRELIAQSRRLMDRPPPPDGMGPPGDDHGMRPDRPPFGGFRRRATDANSPLRMRLFDAKGSPLDPNDTSTPLDRSALRSALVGPAVLITRTVAGKPVRILYRRIPGHEGPVAVIQDALSLSELNAAASNLDHALLVLAPLAVLLAGLGGLQITRHVLKPVGRLTQAAAQIGAADLSARLTVTGRDEFSELASTFNGMLDRLETAFREQQRLIELQRRFVADASHELRTPLTVVKGNTSLALSGSPTVADYRQSMEEINRAADMMSRLVLDLLLLARSDSNRLARNPIVLPIAEALHRATSGIARRKVTVHIDVPDAGLCVRGNEDEITRVFANLLDNAARYTSDGESVSVGATREGGQVCVRVADTGPGIAPEHLAHLGERFYRVDASRSRGEGGSGLGLSICKSIVEAHGGSISFESALGKGTTVTVRLPVADEGQPIADV